MNIDWVVPHFYPEVGGGEIHVEQISKQLAERGHDVAVHTSAVTFDKKRLPLKDDLEGVKIQRYKPLFNRGYYLCYWKPQIRKCELVVMEGYPSLTNDYVGRKFSGKFPMVMIPLGVVIKTSGFGTVLKRFYDSLIGVRTLKKANRIVTLTEVEKNWCSKKGMDSSIIDIIPAGVYDEAFDRYDEDIAMQKFSFENYILFIGRLHPEKAPTHLVRALSKIHEDYKDLGVIFIGPDHGEVTRINSLAKKMGLEKNVIYGGKVTNKEKYELLAGCEFLVLPSKFEAQGIVFIEAWAQKKPVIGTNVGGVPYIIKDGETGLLYNYGDIDALAEHMKFLLENNNKAIEMGDRGFEIALRNYRWRSVVDRMEQVFSDAVNKFSR